MDEFLNEDIYCAALYEFFIRLKDFNLNVDVKVDTLKLFNEVFYQLTRIYYENPTPEDYPRYISDIKANLGWSYSADLVMTIIYTYLRSKKGAINPYTSAFVRYIEYMNRQTPFWQPFLKLTMTIGRWPMKAPYPEKPCPVPPKELDNMYINWKSITQNYDVNVAKDICDLWEKVEDKKDIAKMMMGSVTPDFSSLTILKSWKKDYNFLKHMSGEDDMKSGASMIFAKPTPEEQRLQEELEQVKKEKMILLGRIEELEAEIENLNALLSPQNNYGKNRKFTLVEIVEYCKKKPDPEAVRGVVPMLYWLLRNGTNEEFKMVDSIDEEFNKKKYGIIVQGDYIHNKNVSNEVNGVAPRATGINVSNNKEE